MPQIKPAKTLQEVIEQIGLYPADAYAFIDQALAYTVEKAHGPDALATAALAVPETEKNPQRASTHINGQQLCHGLRELALKQWGMLASTVLRRWNITRTEDIGRIVFALVDNGFMSKTDHDSPADFNHVFDFASAFDAAYRVEDKSPAVPARDGAKP